MVSCCGKCSYTNIFAAVVPLRCLSLDQFYEISRNWGSFCTKMIASRLKKLAQFKALMPITFSSPRAQPEVVYFLISNESPYFSDCKSKFQLQILCSFGDITKSMKLNPETNFLCIFIIASSPGVHTFFCLWRVNKKLPRGETSQNEFQRSRSID